MTKLVLLSDNHTKIHGIHIPDADILVHAGDISSKGEKYTIEEFFEWMKFLTHVKYKIFIAGNHDKSFDTKYGGKQKWLLDLIEDGKQHGIYYLENSGVTLEGIRFYGMPWTPWFYGDFWAFNAKPEEMKEYVDAIPECDVLITHGPPKNILDRTNNGGGHVGCPELKRRIEELQPTLAVFGHIHEGNGYMKLGSTDCFNVSLLDELYNHVNQPIIYNYEHLL